jgi:N-acyl-D-amino-acid deacylase
MRRRVFVKNLLFTVGAAIGFRFCERVAAGQGSFDLVIENARVADGTGKPLYPADVGIRHGRIDRIGSLHQAPATKRIDARGLVLAPGFIDVHTHLEEQIKRVNRRLAADNFVQQGVTTVITGNCGTSAPDIAAFLQKLQRLRLGVNIATLVGHNTVRQVALGLGPRQPTPGQLRTMEARVESGLAAGAVGFSTGLGYRPGVFAAESEVVSLVGVAARHGAAYVTHLRDEGAGEMAALEEAIRTARQAGAPKLHISHYKVVGRSQWGTAALRLARLRKAEEGQRMRMTVDVYPYTALSSTLDYLIPEDALRALRGSPVQKRENFERALEATLSKLRRDGWEDYSHVRLAFSKRHKEWIGRSIPEIVGSLRGTSRPSARDQAAWILQNYAPGDIQMIAAAMSEGDLQQILSAPDVVFGSDSSVHYRGVGRPHPRGSGTFPRIFAEYVRKQKLLTLEEAVRRATGLAAEIFDLPERGLIREGYWADLVLFDPATIQDRATFEDPWRPPEGIQFVIENGELVVRNGKLTGLLPGKVVRRSLNPGPGRGP